MRIGVDLGGSHIGIGLIDDEQNIVEKYEKNFSSEDKENIIGVIEDYIVEIINQIKNNYEPQEKLERIGIAVPGSTKNGVIIKTVNLGINDYNISEALNKKLNLPVFVENDGKCACIAEYNNLLKNNKVSEQSNILFLNIGTGIGGGVIYNGKLLKGHQFDGCEFGHIIIKENGIPCRCGKKGCFEKYGSILEYKNKVRQRLGISQDISGAELRDIMDARKDEIEDLKNQYVMDLCIGISNLINIFEPDCIVIGGGFAHFSYMFIDDIKFELINGNLLFNKREDISIIAAELGNDAGIIGAGLI